MPCAPTTSTGLPATRTAPHAPGVTGAENGIGGPGCGAPLAGLGIRWIAQVACTLSPRTAAGTPIGCRSLQWSVGRRSVSVGASRAGSVELDDGAVDVD